MGIATETKWHTKSVSEVLEILKSSEHGLSSVEAKLRLAQNGPNKLPEAKVENIFVIFLRQFESPLIYILLAASVIVYIMGETIDSIVIMSVLIFNAVIGAIQEGKARNTMLALKRFVETKAVVARDETELIITDEEVVPGDIIVLQEGEKIPADARLISSHNLKINEAALTGESKSVHKHTNPLANPELPAPEQRNMVFKGTNVAGGNGLAVVSATGSKTIIGEIAKKVATIDTDIPLKTNIKNLSRIFIIATAVVSVVLFTLGMFSGYSIREMFATTVSLAVSAIPSGLPIALTIILAAGVWRMSKRNALVKRLQAVEALGQAQVIAVDKTGTITKNEMMVETVFTEDKIFEIGGVGYEPKGEARLLGEIIEPPNHPELIRAGKIASLCASARTVYSEEKKEWRVSGDPTEAALLVLGSKLGFKKDDLERELPFLSEIPFDYNLKYHTTLHKEDKKGILTVVGAPEVLLALCTKIFAGGTVKKISKAEKEKLGDMISHLSRKGLRVLAFSQKSIALGDINRDNIKDLTFGGFFGLKDALRLEVKESTLKAQSAGLRVVMITGDHRDTATTIAREANIYKDGDLVITGNEIEAMTEVELASKLDRVSVFARVTPEHKLRIIQAYRARGEIIAMTGDGVNDAPSLVASDLGVAMGISGTEVAKEASDIILLDDNFSSIVSAIEEGRGIYKTIKKVIVYLVSTSIGEVLVITGSLIIGLPLPLLAAQIIWLNFITDGFFIPAVAMEPRENNLLKTRFEKGNKYLVDRSMAIRMFLMATPMTVFTLMLFAATYQNDLAKAMTMALTLLAVFQWFNAWNSRSETESIFSMNPWGNKFLIAGTFVAFLFQLLAVYHPFFQTFLRTVPLGFSDWLIIITLATSIILVEEMRKLVNRRKLVIIKQVETVQA
ncbi:MAG: ATPase [Candidatus Zambryskibacteria bacterium CG_4_9_14_3_um_filter_42_9]|uniref:ATPase n=1 Tax=Candidatus Zambryskibacteria bacterium CG22_combo_CG10-13_8_21_14_all_42_17 TaxID=1975118 RepID=A0A2H0BD85_9BACT|nr:MAG: ATPase [Candidatus Zambryskibacteria bacterium CG22_combo_CG10-13_8_21_14_all_42_17]PJA36916.1 MAG: ATPase [Candidatus Zambryskibacteria bacterium CG_4_9_14_3_um_filter_42_9]